MTANGRPARRKSRGVVYAAIGARYIEEAAVSAASVRVHLPGLPILLFCNEPPAQPTVFDEVRIVSERCVDPHLDKLAAMRDSPFDETLFLDVDTFICAPPDGLFELLERFDIAMAHDPRYGEPFPADTGVPAAFPEFNQGVVLLRKSDAMTRALQAALDEAHRSGRHDDDQAAFRVALYRSHLRIAPLAPEYNARFHGYGYLSSAVKILHGRIPTRPNQADALRRTAQRINRVTLPRVFIAGQIHALVRWRLRNFDHYVSRSAGTLFGPRRAIVRRFGRGILRKIGLGRH